MSSARLQRRNTFSAYAHCRDNVIVINNAMALWCKGCMLSMNILRALHDSGHTVDSVNVYVAR